MESVVNMKNRSVNGVEIYTTKIDGIEYYNVRQFAALTNRTEQSVRYLISKGNKVRYLSSIKIVGSILIPKKELTAYPFTTCGRNFEVYHYDNQGSIIENSPI